MVRGITERLARACAAHPRRTLGAWAVAVVVALVLVATSLHGLTSNAHVVGSPESTKAANAIATAFPPTPADLKRQVSDVVVVSSVRYGVESPLFRSLVSRLVEQLRTTGKVISARSYLSGNRSLVSRDGHATLVQLFVKSDAAIKPVLPLVQQASRTPGFEVAITGDHTVANDFNTLSQRDLEHGELEFGLPAALVVLLLVFGAVVAGLVPVLMAILSILVGLGLVALALARVRPLGVHREHAHRDGTRARDRLLALRHLALPRGTDARAREDGRDRPHRRDGEQGRALQRQHVRGRAVRDAARADDDHAQPRRRRDHRRRRLGRRRADAAAGAAQPARRPRRPPARAGPRPQPRPRRQRRGPLLAVDHRGRPAPPRAQPRPQRRADARAGRPRLRPPHRRQRRHHPAEQPALEAGLPRAPADVPGAEPLPGRDRRRRRKQLRRRGRPREAEGATRCRPALRPRHHPDRAPSARLAALGARPRRRRQRPRRRGRTRPAQPRSPRRLRRHRRTRLRRRQDSRERRLLRRRHQPDPLRARVRARAQLHRAHRRLPLTRRRARLDPASTCSRSAPPTGCSPSSSSTARAPDCSASSTSTRSTPGSPSSSSPSSSASRWTTRSS